MGGKDSQIYVNEKLIQSETISWIGGGSQLPEGVTIDGNLKIVTVQDRPFVFVTDMSQATGGKCNNVTHTVCIEYESGRQNEGKAEIKTSLKI